MVKGLNMNENHPSHRHHHSKYLYTIMEPETYGGLLNPTSSISSCNTNNYDNRSSLRRHIHKKRSENLKSLDSQDERIEVKILPQDENWGETTAVSCHGGNDDTLTTINETNIQMNDPIEQLPKRTDPRTRSILISHFILYFLCLLAYLSPLLFLSLPYILRRSEFIQINDYTLLLTILFKLLLLFVGVLLLFYRRRNTIYFPRIHRQELIFFLVLITIIFTYWFYYIFKLLQRTIIQYESILSMTSTYEDLLLFFLFIVILILEIKWLYPKYIVKIVRSPDGHTRQYTIGSMSIQEASIYLLEQYYKDFPVFNPWLENVQQIHARQNGTLTTKSIGSQSNASMMTSGTNGHRDSQRSMRGYNDRFYDELDYERRVRKRQTKLLSSCEDAFTHVRKYFQEKSGSHIPMDAREAAQAVFSSMSRSLQKYLRITRQQPYFTRESIISHLTICLSHDLSPRAFLERYTQTNCQPLATLLFPSLNNNIEQSWTIECHPDKDENQSISINQSIHSKLIFVLKQKHAEHIALICSFHPIPRVHLIEKIFDIKRTKFILKLNSETSV